MRCHPVRTVCYLLAAFAVAGLLAPAAPAGNGADPGVAPPNARTHGLSYGDVIEYLPVNMLVPDAVGWEELRLQHARELEADKQLPRAFKPWLTRKYGADFSDDQIRNAARALDSIPSDLMRLLKTVEAHLTVSPLSVE